MSTKFSTLAPVFYARIFGKYKKCKIVFNNVSFINLTFWKSTILEMLGRMGVEKILTANADKSAKKILENGGVKQKGLKKFEKGQHLGISINL